jgi:WD40 repeat protein
VAFSDDATRVAIAAPGRVWVLNLTTGRATIATRTQEPTALAWAPEGPGAPPSLVVAERSGAITLFRPAGPTGIDVPGEPLAIDMAEGVVSVATTEGSLHTVRLDDRTTDELVGLCCEGVAAATLGPDRAVLACAATCDTAAVLVERATLDTTAAEGMGHPERGTSVSPEGDRFTTGGPTAAQSVLLWTVAGPRPLAWLGRGPAKSVAWSPDGQAVLTVGTDGDVWHWDVPAVRQRRSYGE